MNTPDAGRIRVRWYRVAEVPGVYDMGDYTSSNFDADPQSYSPPSGEESSTRDPYLDWRDCCPPPWFGWRDDICPTAVTPCAFTYRMPKLTLSGVNVPVRTWLPLDMVNIGPCQWAGGPVVVGPDSYRANVALRGDGSLLLVITLRHGILRSCVGTYTAPGPVDMQQPLHLVNITSGAFPVTGPAYITVRPVPDDVLGIDPCTGIVTGAGDFILAT